MSSPPLIIVKTAPAEEGAVDELDVRELRRVGSKLTLVGSGEVFIDDEFVGTLLPDSDTVYKKNGDKCSLAEFFARRDKAVSSSSRAIDKTRKRKKKFKPKKRTRGKSKLKQGADN